MNWKLISIIGVGLVLLISIIRNMFTGSFSIGKFFSGFNIFAGGVQGKLLYWGILAILGYGLFHQLTRATTDYNTDYRNNVHDNEDVYFDQRVGEDGCSFELLYGLVKIGCKQQPITKQATEIKPGDIAIDQRTKAKPEKPIEKVKKSLLLETFER